MSVSWRRDFVESALRFLEKEGYAPERIKEALEAGWTVGASVAFYLPEHAYEEIGPEGRRAFSFSVLETWVRQTLGDDWDDDEGEELVDDVFKSMESIGFGLMNMAKGSPDWIIGRRSKN